MSNILGEKNSFKHELISTYDRFDHEIKNGKKTPIITDIDTVFRMVKKTFEFRHIFCHELAFSVDFNLDLINKCFENCKLLLHATDNLISHILYPNSPLTTPDMLKNIDEKCKKAFRDLEYLCEKIKKYLNSEQIEKFNNMQNQWLLLRELQSSFIASKYDGGTLMPVAALATLYSITIKRIEELSDIFIELIRGRAI